MEESVRRRLFGKLLGIINQRAKLGFAAVVHIKEFESVITGIGRTSIGLPYRLGCTSCYLEVGEWAKRNYQIEPIDFIFDAGHRDRQEARQSFRESKQNPEFIEYRLGSITFANDKVHIPIQAADIAAYELWKWLDEHYADKTRRGRYGLQEIIKIPWTIREFD
jgi:hypothetical protein